MLRKTFIPMAALGLMILAIACSGKKNEEEEQHQHSEAASEDWNEMDDFHMVMAEAFHPYKDSANLEPAKMYADSLVATADRWSSAPLPEKFSEDDEIKFKLNQLKVDASTFAEIAKTGNDKAIGESLTKLHDLFHEIQEAWYSNNHQ
jgi:hypothetical protein